ncbi:MAG: hypothetical protein KBE23_06635 [Chloroflexi bacterium]|nr:hypothetical protein [Chloroflexota bacterium]MBP7042402.1 hypothetical protein [Chloroflexota bacterium]
MTNPLRQIQSFDQLIPYLEDELDWPLQQYGFDDLTFEYTPAELGLKDDDAVKIKTIHQLRPLQQGQPWGIFFVEFENKKLPVVVLRRILSHLVIKKRASANRADAAAWAAGDLLFISAFGNSAANNRELAFAHFHQEGGELPTLRVLGWDGGDTPLKLEHVAATLKDRLSWPDDPNDKYAWRTNWAGAFRHRQGHVIRTADALAEALAALARRIRDAALLLLEHETEKGTLRTLHKAFQTALIHDLSEADFADTYAQTITYGLLTAAISRTEMSDGVHGTALIAENIADIVPVTNPFLKEMLQTFLKVGGRKGGIDFDELGIQDVVELLRGDETDLPAVLRDFGNKTQGEDPVIHFYEHFLAAYDKKLKVQRGVFYTPKPVVSYIVRSVHELLQTEFGLADGLADTTTWGEMAQRQPDLKIPEGTSPNSPFVVILDPATGTATFLVEVVDVIHQTLTAKWQKAGLNAAQRKAAWNDYVPHHLLPRLYGYELMMAPYAIAHMKMGLKLYETGYRFISTERVRIYLTNALEPASNVSPQLPGFSPALAREANAVNLVKNKTHFTIIVGNPPYAKISSNRNISAEKLVEAFKADVRNERNIQPLSDDYIKFLGLMLSSAKLVSCFVFGMITNRGYLPGLIHRGIRKVFLDNFDMLWIIDLHGDSNIQEPSPKGLANENVFDIQQGVAITLGTKTMHEQANVRLLDIWGTREEKQLQLNQLKFSSINWTKCNPLSPNYFFQSQKSIGDLQDLTLLTKAMPVTSTGIKTHRDDLVIDFSPKVLKDRIHEFVDPDKTVGEIRESFFGHDRGGRYLPGDNRDWSLVKARHILQKEPENLESFFRRIDYRPFDNRVIFYHPAAIDFAREDLMNHMDGKKNLGLITTRQVPNGSFCHAFVTRNYIEMKTGSHDRGTNLFPLYLNNRSTVFRFSESQSLNFSERFLRDLFNKLEIRPRKGLIFPDGIVPEDVFQYIYAVLYSPTFRDFYADSLKVNFPYIPLTSNLLLFRALAQFGGKLVTLHLLEFSLEDETDTPTGWPHYPRLAQFTGSNRVIEKFPSANKAWQDGRVAINGRSSFIGVPEEVWDFHIGGYQVCHKWLKDRKGRTLTDADILHYCKIVTAIHETIRIMAEIDEVIEKHGGWPIQ